MGEGHYFGRFLCCGRWTDGQVERLVLGRGARIPHYEDGGGHRGEPGDVVKEEPAKEVNGVSFAPGSKPCYIPDSGAGQ
jgi:hypothetical protein